MSFTRIAACFAVLVEAYESWKCLAQRPIQRGSNVTSADHPVKGASTEKDDEGCRRRIRQEQDEQRRNMLRFWLMFGLYSYTQRFFDAALGRIPFYGVAKLALTSALLLPNQAVRASLYTALEPYLLHVSSRFEYHSFHVLRRLFFLASGTMLLAAGWSMRNGCVFLTASQVDDVKSLASDIVQCAKEEKTRRLQESVKRIMICGDDDNSSDEDENHATSAGVACACIEEEQCDASSSADTQPSICATSIPLAHLSEGEEEEAENQQPSAYLQAGSILPSTPKHHRFVSPSCSPSRKAHTPHPPRTPLSTRSHACPTTPPTHTGTGTLQPSSSLSQRLCVLEVKGNELETLRERTTTPQKTKLWETTTAEKAMKKKRQTMGV